MPSGLKVTALSFKSIAFYPVPELNPYLLIYPILLQDISVKDKKNFKKLVKCTVYKIN
jgi:hypothetical protein